MFNFFKLIIHLLVLYLNQLMTSTKNFVCFYLSLSILILAANFQDPIEASSYAQVLGKGFDVTWSQFKKYSDAYKEEVVTDFYQAGFRNVRIRINLQKPTLNTTFMTNLRKQVSNCVTNGIYPILAYQGFILQEGTQTDAQNKAHLAEWWENMTIAFKGYSYMLSFNVLIEISGKYKDDYVNINDFYSEIYKRVRRQDTSRILIYPPVHLSSPQYLQYLIIPGGNTQKFVMVEWHFYAAGPNPDTKSKKYWINGSTEEERSGVLQPISIAVNWSQVTGYKLWVGAWMSGNYNSGNNYSIVEQVRFGSFLAQSLASYNIPWAINADNKFYNFSSYDWIVVGETGGIAIRDTILDPSSVCLYPQTNYNGGCLRLPAGVYNQSHLKGINFISVLSLMVPYGYEVKIITSTNSSIITRIYQESIASIQALSVSSIEVKKK